jgi:hypothetical protein
VYKSEKEGKMVQSLSILRGENKAVILSRVLTSNFLRDKQKYKDILKAGGCFQHTLYKAAA